MISAYMGTPGSGKSLHAAEQIYDWLRSGRTVICNFPVNLAAIDKLPDTAQLVYLPSDYITPGFLWRHCLMHCDLQSRREKQVLLVLDEVGQMFDPRELQQGSGLQRLQVRREWCQWFPVSRKLRFECILIAQDFRSQVDRQIYAQCEVDVWHRAVKNMGTVYALLSFFRGGLFQAVYKLRRQRIAMYTEVFRYHKKYGKLYDTFDLFLGGDFIGPPEPISYSKQQLRAVCSERNTAMLRAL